LTPSLHNSNNNDKPTIYKLHSIAQQ
uniref:Uncharacterized protein n=1 Tax=Amphimedon queenslandica TaxID=400682 RepID=A0A1X7VMB4_AMPQE